MGRENRINDPRFDTNTKRQEREAELTGIFEGLFAAKTADDWEQALFEVRVPAAKVHTIQEAFLHPQAKSREMLISIDDHPLGKKMKMAANPIKDAESSDSKIEYNRRLPSVNILRRSLRLY